MNQDQHDPRPTDHLQIEVNPLGPAAALGVAEGFQLVYVDGRRVKNVEVFDALEEIESFPCKEK